jgi:hypothetical protein
MNEALSRTTLSLNPLKISPLGTQAEPRTCHSQKAPILFSLVENNMVRLPDPLSRCRETMQ